MSKTPLIDALKAIKTERYHMPGHKGNRPDGFPDPFLIDFTETSKTGNLFLEDGPIFASETLYREYFGAKQCIYLTGGSTQGILTAIFTLKPKKMLCDRNSHKSLCNALGLCDVEPVFVFPTINTEFDIPDVIDPLEIDKKLKENPDINTVFITSPNYYGIYSDIEAISEICHKNKAKLIVDEAHGCHFPAISVKNAIMSGADIAITSAHKTTDSLGQGAVLLSNDTNLPLRKNSSIFGTSSPSYVILSSIEIGLKNTYLYQKMPVICADLKEKIQKLTKFKVLNHKNSDPCRLTINTKFLNITGTQLQKNLEDKFGIFPEMSDANNVVFIITPQDNKLPFLIDCLINISDQLKITEENPASFEFFEPKPAISVREAMFSEEKEVFLKNAVNKISKQIIAPYPPGVAIIYPGEIILDKHIEYITKICYNDFDKIYIVDK